MTEVPSFDKIYAQVVKQVLTQGGEKPTRQKGSEGTLSCTGVYFKLPANGCTELSGAKKYFNGIGFDEDTPFTFGKCNFHGLPDLACKRVHTPAIAAELAWFLGGETNVKTLQDRGCKIWNKDAAAMEDRGLFQGEGNLGPIYGHQWRKRPDGDQILKAMKLLCEEPFSRRIVVNSWNCDDLSKMGLPPCHLEFQFVVDQVESSLVAHADKAGEMRAASPAANGKVNRVSCIVNMRSCDVGLGLPFNVVSYALLTSLICAEIEHHRQIIEIRSEEWLRRDADARGVTLAYPPIRMALPGSPEMEDGNKYFPTSISPSMYIPGDVIFMIGDCHIYKEHIAGMERMNLDETSKVFSKFAFPVQPWEEGSPVADSGKMELNEPSEALDKAVPGVQLQEKGDKSWGECDKGQDAGVINSFVRLPKYWLSNWERPVEAPQVKLPLHV
jgi:thymidylate synthase